MSRGPGKIERRLRAMLADQGRLGFTTLGLIREAFEIPDHDDLTEPERSSGARALRRILAGSSAAWRISSDRPPGMNGNARLFVRVGLASTTDGRTPIWAYGFGERSVEWQPAAIVRRTSTHCTVRVDSRTYERDAYLRPLDRTILPEWIFVSVRTEEAERRANAAHRAWLAGSLTGEVQEADKFLPPPREAAPASDEVRAARESLRETRARLDDWLSRHNAYIDDNGNFHFDRKLPADLVAAYRRAISSRDITVIYALRTKLVGMLERIERRRHDFDAPMREWRAGRRRSEFAIMPRPDC